jgi:hypothetical protein
VDRAGVLLRRGVHVGASSSSVAASIMTSVAFAPIDADHGVPIRAAKFVIRRGA